MLIGHLDHADISHISGWARDAGDPTKRLELEVYDGDRFITRLIADRPRPDLAAAGVGDGHYGFWTPLPREMFPFSVHLLSVRFRETGVDLRNSPKPVYPRQGGIDPAFGEWFNRHIDNAAAAAAEPRQLAPLFTLCANALARLMHAEARLEDASGSVSVGSIDQAALPARLKAALEKAFEACPPLHVPIFRQPKLSIIVAGVAGLRENHACLTSIVASRGLSDYEVIFVDTTGTVDMVLAPFLVKGGIRFVKTPQPAPILEAYRTGLALAAGQRLVFLGHVVSVEPDAIAALSATLDAVDGPAVVTPRLVGADGRIVEAGSRLGAMAARLPTGHREPGDAGRYRTLRNSDDVSARAFMIDRATLLSVGQFDGIDDFGDLGIADLAFRLREAGAAVLAQGFAGVSIAGRGGVARANRRGRANFVAKWQHVLPAADAQENTAQPKRALVIDERLPDPNRDAASQAVLSHCESLIRLGYCVEFVPLSFDSSAREAGASLFMRGIEAHVEADNAADLLRARAGQFDLVYLHRLSVARDLMATSRATQPAARIVYNVADLHFLRLRRRAGIEANATFLAESEFMEADERTCLAGADVVITHSTDEEAWIRGVLPGANVRRVMWTQRINPAVAPFGERRNFCFVGTYGHEPNVDAVGHFLRAMWPKVRDGLPDATFEIAGSHLAPGMFDTGLPGVVPRGYFADARSYLAQVRVMLAPLRFGAGVKGKVLLAFAEGLPCVMSGIAAEGLELPAAIRELLVAADEEAFVRKAVRFYTDSTVWTQASGLVREWAAANLSPSAIDRDIAAALAAAATGGPDPLLHRVSPL